MSKAEDTSLRSNRVAVMLSDAELTAIDNWRYSNRIASRGDAMRRLCAMSISSSSHAASHSKLVDALKSLLSSGVEVFEMPEYGPVLKARAVLASLDQESCQ